MNYRHECTIDNAQKMLDWIKTRGGVAVWSSLNLSNPGASWSTPVLSEYGKPYPKPTWQAADAPEKVITDAAEIAVVAPREVKRFHVAVRTGSQGMSLKLTDGSTRRVRAAVAKAGEGAWYEFDYGAQEVVIFVPGEKLSLADWAAKKEAA